MPGKTYYKVIQWFSLGGAPVVDFYFPFLVCLYSLDFLHEQLLL